MILSTDLAAGKKLIAQVQFQGLTGGFRDVPRRNSLPRVSQEIPSFLLHLNSMFDHRFSSVFFYAIYKM